MKYTHKGDKGGVADNGGIAYLAGGLRPKEIGLMSTSIKGSIGHGPDEELLAHALTNYIFFGPDTDRESLKEMRYRANEVKVLLALYSARNYARDANGAAVLKSIERAFDFARAAHLEISTGDVGEVVEILMESEGSLRESKRSK
ncbi:MAG TPA: hypothetical protein VJI46_01815 [Candidatus Nanoarchaeia archaeon]|nr:hypothetical protein [Candidatus Nanoarchaeia archaeon]